MLLFNILSVFNLPTATKNLITNYTFFVRSFMPMDCFQYDRDLRHERVKPRFFFSVRETRRNEKFLKSTLTISDKY